MRVVALRSSPSLVISVIGLLVLLGGTGFAASHLTQRPTAPAKARHRKQACVAAVTTTLCAPLRAAVDAEIAKDIRTLNLHSGAQGAPGPQGIPGPPGLQGNAGPGAITLTRTLPTNTLSPVTLATLNNGLTVTAQCGGSNQPLVTIQPTSPTLEGSGLTFRGSSGAVQPTFLSAGAYTVYDVTSIGFFGLVRDPNAGGKFAQLYVFGGDLGGNSCLFEGMVVPSG